MNGSNSQGQFFVALLAIAAILIVMVVSIFLWLMQTIPASAATGDLNSFVSNYPNTSKTTLDQCSLCHTSSIPNLNPYGADYKSHGRNVAAFGAIESLDSDKDGFSNLAEITALKLPGDPNSHPAVNPTPTTGVVPSRTPTGVGPSPTPTRTPVPVGGLIRRLFLPLITDR